METLSSRDSHLFDLEASTGHSLSNEGPGAEGQAKRKRDRDAPGKDTP